MKTACVGMLSLLCAPAAVHAQAFGVVPGAPVSKYAPTPTKDKHYYNIQVPNPNDEFVNYVAYATQADGICKVIATGKGRQGDSSGANIRKSFRSFKESLFEKYGKSFDFDYIKSTSIWKADKDFAQALSDHDRRLVSIWQTITGSAMQGWVRMVVLEANASNSTTTNLKITYDFDNIDNCSQSVTKENAKGL
jgi:hypothetical protein